MSKLYVKAHSDRIKNAKTARGHREIDANILYNFHGGQEPLGNIATDVSHDGTTVYVTITHYHGGTILFQKRYNVNVEGEVTPR